MRRRNIKTKKNEMSIRENKGKKCSKLEKNMKIYVTNQVSVKKIDSNFFVDSMQSIDKLSVLVLSSAEKLESR